MQWFVSNEWPLTRLDIGGLPSSKVFNEWHILAITQAICEYRAGQVTTGPLTKALSLNK
jgi:hypothetical protein